MHTGNYDSTSDQYLIGMSRDPLPDLPDTTNRLQPPPGTCVYTQSTGYTLHRNEKEIQ